MDPRNRFILRATIGYAAFAAVWIFFSDRMLAGLTSVETVSQLATVKGMAFVAVTSVLLFLALRAEPAPSPRLPPPAGRRWVLVATLLLLTVAVASIGLVTYRVQSAAIKADQLAQLRAVADLKVANLADWLHERRQDAGALARNQAFRSTLARWLRRPTAADRQYLLDSLEAFRANYGYAGIDLVDGRGRPLLDAGGQQHPPEFLAPAVARAMAVQEPILLDLHRHRQDDGVHMAYVIAVAGPGGEPIAAVVLGIAPERQLFPSLRAWPLPSRTGEALLVRAEGGEVVFLNELRHRPGKALSLRLPLASPDLPAARALRGETEVQEGIDYRDVPVLAVARPVPETPWILIAKEDEEEALAGIRRLAWLAGLLTALALAVAGGFVLFLWQRQQLQAALAEATQARALEQAETRFRVTFEQAAVGIALVAADGRWLRVNQRLCDILGYAREDLLATSFQAITLPEDLSADVEALRRFEAGEIEQYRAEKRYLHKDGRPVWIALTVAVVRDAAGRPDYYITVVEDVARRKAAEEAIARMARIHRALSETNEAIVRITDRQELLAAICRIAVEHGGLRLARICRVEGDPPVLVTIASQGPAAGLLEHPLIRDYARHGSERQRILGLVSRGEHFIARDVAAERMLAPWAEAYAAFGIAGLAIFPIPSTDGSLQTVFFYAPDRDYFDDDMVRLLDEMAQDIAFGLASLERAEHLQRYRENLETMVEERTAELREAKEHAEAADRVKSAFLATMSHELRTPLNSILGFTGILLQRLAGPLNEEQEKQLGIVHDASRHLLALINDVLDISKIEAGQLRLHLEPFDLAALLAHAADTYRPQAERRGLGFECAIADDLGTVLGDSRRVEQVVLNLLANALKFTERGRLRLTARRAGAIVEVSVEDTGIGIRSEDMDKLFRPFQQLDTAPSRLREGTGLGLAICRHLVAAMGGEIRAESRPGDGSRFSFTLPVEGRP